jgi:hypothetical protein
MKHSIRDFTFAWAICFALACATATADDTLSQRI